MRSYQNPFRSRASEQQRDTYGFLRYFGPGMLDLLPEAIWDRPLIVRSAPGGGKTTLMRLFTIESLQLVSSRRDDFDTLASRLTELEAISANEPARLGVLLNLGRDYRALPSVGAPSDATVRLFFRLLDARIMAAVVRSVVLHGGLRFPADASEVRLSLASSEIAAETAAQRVGGLNGADILRSSREAEQEIAELLDSLLPVDWGMTGRGHSELYSLRLLSEADISVRDRPIDASPIILLDDGHELAATQREALLRVLLDRSLDVARWYAERFEALDPSEMLRGDTAGRDYELVQLEQASRSARRSGRSANRFLLEVGNLRAARHLEQYAHADRDFTEYLELPAPPMSSAVLNGVREQAQASAGNNPRYQAWLQECELPTVPRDDRAIRLRSAVILIERERRRPQRELFDLPSEEEFSRVYERNSNLREAARLFLAKEHELPYYAGAETIAGLSSNNVEQFLRLCGDLFSFMLGRITLDERPAVSAQRQDAIMRRASDAMWREIVGRVPHGRDVLTVLEKIGAVAVSETYRPTASYAPGVTGIAISMTDRQLLLDEPEAVANGPELRNMLAAAAAHNVLTVELDYAVKNTRVMVLYLNRLLCPRLGLPIQRGGFRERPVREIAGWLTRESDSAAVSAETPPALL